MTLLLAVNIAKGLILFNFITAGYFLIGLALSHSAVKYYLQIIEKYNNGEELNEVDSRIYFEITMTITAMGMKKFITFMYMFITLFWVFNFIKGVQKNLNNKS